MCVCIIYVCLCLLKYIATCTVYRAFVPLFGTSVSVQSYSRWRRDSFLVPTCRSLCFKARNGTRPQSFHVVTNVGPKIGYPMVPISLSTG